ncbi:MAG: hypothetical protein FWE13_05955 [Firmicutes bacterium]|nr:hypothetical protein [Bacillota bacterium]
MIITKFVNWGNEKKQYLEEKGIKTVKIFTNEFGGYIDHEAISCLGRIAFNIEGHVDMEIFEIESEVKLMMCHYAFQSDAFDDLFSSYIRILSDSTSKI